MLLTLGGCERPQIICALLAMKRLNKSILSWYYHSLLYIIAVLAMSSLVMIKHPKSFQSDIRVRPGSVSSATQTKLFVSFFLAMRTMLEPITDRMVCCLFGWRVTLYVCLCSMFSFLIFLFFLNSCPPDWTALWGSRGCFFQVRSSWLCLWSHLTHSSAVEKLKREVHCYTLYVFY